MPKPKPEHEFHLSSDPHPPFALGMSTKDTTYQDVTRRITALIEGETDIVTIMSTISCELFHAFDHFNWVGFYRRVDHKTLKAGPYQGTHGCLTIDISRGVCGACVRQNAVQLENDVSSVKDHIACSSETKSEIVVPVRAANGEVTAVLDIDSTTIGVFDGTDISYLQDIAGLCSR